MSLIPRAIHPVSSTPVSIARLSLCVVITACTGAGEDPAPEVRTIERLRERSGAVSCERLETFPENGSVVEDLVAASDSTFLVLLPLEREVRLYDHALRPVFGLRFEESGPLGVRTPRSATVVDDTLVYITDLGGRRVRILSRSGKDRGTIRTTFSPDRIRSGPVGIFLTAFPLGGGRGADLVHVLDGTGTRPIGLPILPHDDLRIEGLGNILVLTVLPGGEVVAAHRILNSRAAIFRAAPGGTFDAVVTTVPVARPERDRLGEVPSDLFEREDVRDLATPVMAASEDRASGEYLYLTRTGGTLPGGGTEKAIVRSRPDLSYVGSSVLDVNAQDFVYLSRTRTALVIDDEAMWHRCPIP